MSIPFLWWEYAGVIIHAVMVTEKFLCGLNRLVAAGEVTVTWVPF